MPIVLAIQEITQGNESELNQLSCEELDVFRQFSFAKRRQDWLAGRLAAKQAVRKLLRHERQEGQMAIDAASLQILNKASGAPYIDGLPEAHVSISHGGQFAVALATRNTGKTLLPGVDIEPICSVDRDLLDLAFSQKEQAWIGNNAFAFFQLWTAKEAILKTLGTGLEEDPRVIALAEILGDGDNPIVCTRFVHTKTSHTFLAQTTCFMHHVLSICI